MTYLILGYAFECREFQYQGRTVKGLAFEVKTNEKISERNKNNIAVELSKKRRILDSSASNCKRH